GEPVMNPSANGIPGAEGRGPVRFLVLSASSRKDSLNHRLARLAVRRIEDHGGMADFAEMKEFDCPSYDQDGHHRNSSAAGAEQFRKRLEANDAFIISSAEYDFSMPGYLKNSIDWVLRFDSIAFIERTAFV